MIFPDRPGLGNCSSDSFGFCRLLLAGPACCNLCKGPPCVDSWHKGNMKLLTNRILSQDPTFIDRVAEARLPLAALVLTMNLTVALEVDIFTWAAYSKMSVTKNSWELEAGADGQPWKDSTHPGLWTLWQLDWTGGLHHQDWLTHVHVCIRVRSRGKYWWLFTFISCSRFRHAWLFQNFGRTILWVSDLKVYTF